MDDLFALDPTKVANWVDALNSDDLQDKLEVLNKQMRAAMIQLECVHVILDEAGIKRFVMRDSFVGYREYYFVVEERLSFLVRQIKRLSAQGPRSS